MGQLLGADLALYVYPYLCSDTGQVRTVNDLELTRNSKRLLSYLLDVGSVRALDNFNPDVLHIHSPQVLERIAANDDSWKDMVPANAAQIIADRKLFWHQ